jgi:hypothetical protein
VRRARTFPAAAPTAREVAATRCLAGCPPCARACSSTCKPRRRRPRRGQPRRGHPRVPRALAVTVYRVAHELYAWAFPHAAHHERVGAHTQTGADIHPGATIGGSFFIDHATGVVVGETSHLGARVKLYQGVTLGALSHAPRTRGEPDPRDQAPPHRRGRRHHLRERHGARGTDRGGRGQRRGRVCVSDEERPEGGEGGDEAARATRPPTPAAATASGASACPVRGACCLCPPAGSTSPRGTPWSACRARSAPATPTTSAA